MTPMFYFSFVTLTPHTMSDDKNTNDLVLEEFTAQLAKHGIAIDSIDDEGLVHIQRGGSDLKISLYNVRKNYARDNDKRHIQELVETIVDYNGVGEGLPSDWETARPDIFASLCPRDDFDFHDVLHHPLTEEVEKIYLYTGDDRHTWVAPRNLEDWNITEENLTQQANANADRLLSETEIEIQEIDGHKLGCFNTSRPDLKASLLLAPSLRDRILADFGFPFFAVVPVRDFCYLFSEADSEYLLARLGPTVVDEYQDSGYPVTTEVWRFSDEGIQAIGRYPIDGETD
jgi:hypothetical protein